MRSYKPCGATDFGFACRADRQNNCRKHEDEPSLSAGDGGGDQPWAYARGLRRQRSPLAHGGRPASEKGTMAWNGFILQWTDVWCAAPSWKRGAGCALTARKRVPPCRSRPCRSRSRCRRKRKLAGSEKRNRNNNVVRTKNPYHVLYFAGSFFNRNWAHRPVNRPAAMPHSSSHGR